MKIVTPARLVILAVVAGILAIWYLNRPQPPEVTLTTVERGRVTKTVANTRVGTVKACRRAEIAPATGGQVARLTVTEGDHVEAGQVLLEIWNEDLKARLKLAQSNLQVTRAQAEQACKSAEGAEREARRLERLRKDRLISDEQIDIARTEADAQAAACRAAKAQIQVSAADVEVAQAAVDRTILRAPFAGTVAEVNAELGEYVTPSPPGIPTLPAVDLADTSCLYISAPIDEVDAPAIKVGMPACVTLDAFVDRRCNGEVRRVAPYVLEQEKQARTVEVEVELTNPADRKDMLPGYSADIEILLDAHDNALRIPTETILEDNKVYVYNAETGRITLTSIETGLRNWDYTEVTGGLEQGDHIVLSVGREGVTDGAIVQVQSTGD